MSTHLDNIRETLQQTDSGRRALAVLEAAVELDRDATSQEAESAALAKIILRSELNTTTTAVRRAVRALLAEAPDERPAGATRSPLGQAVMAVLVRWEGQILDTSFDSEVMQRLDDALAREDGREPRWAAEAPAQPPADDGWEACDREPCGWRRLPDGRCEMSTRKLRLWRTDCFGEKRTSSLSCNRMPCVYRRSDGKGGCKHCRELPVTGLWQAIGPEGKPRSACLPDKAGAMLAVLSVMGHNWPHWYRRGWRIVRVWMVREG